jgi:hypothetical protein
MFPFLGSEMIEWFLDWCARLEDRLDRSLRGRAHGWLGHG